MYVLIAIYVASINPAFTSTPHNSVVMQEFTSQAKCEAAKKFVMEQTKRDAICVEK